MPANPPSDIQRVFRHVPHRYPLVLVDHIDACEAGAWVRAHKHVSFDEPFFETIGDTRPSMPPVPRISMDARPDTVSSAVSKPRTELALVS